MLNEQSINSNVPPAHHTHEERHDEEEAGLSNRLTSSSAGSSLSAPLTCRALMHLEALGGEASSADNQGSGVEVGGKELGNHASCSVENAQTRGVQEVLAEEQVSHPRQDATESGAGAGVGGAGAAGDPVAAVFAEFESVGNSDSNASLASPQVLGGTESDSEFLARMTVHKTAVMTPQKKLLMARLHEEAYAEHRNSTCPGRDSSTRTWTPLRTSSSGSYTHTRTHAHTHARKQTHSKCICVLTDMSS